MQLQKCHGIGDNYMRTCFIFHPYNNNNNNSNNNDNNNNNKNLALLTSFIF